MTEEKHIEFYFAKEEYGEFSNFARYPIKLKGKEWITSEHYFQAQKFAGTEYEEIIRNADSPMKAAQLGQTRRINIREDWERVKDDVMYDALKAKFTQYSDLKELLLSTGDKILIEHTKNDNYWADGGDGKGKNKLGILLMKLRDELKQE